MLSIEGLKVAYGHVEALRGIDLEARQDRPIDLPASLDRLEELHPFATDHQPDSVYEFKQLLVDARRG